MKKTLFFAVILLALFVPSRFARAEEVIRDFTVTASVDSERGYTVTEHITYDFGEDERHGIYRDIPVTYLRRGVSYDFRPEVTSVRVDGNVVPYEVTKGGGSIRIKIGDPLVTITGPHTYSITYSTDRAINFFPSGSELYWNVTGNQWPVPIERASFSVVLPPAAAAVQIPMLCYTGPVGSTMQDCVTSQDANAVSFSMTRVLLPEEGLTIVLGLPPGIIREPTRWERWGMLVQDNGVLAFPVIALGIMVAIWWRKGRDPKIGTVIPMYEPPEKMSPAEVAAMEYDGGVPRRGVTATILDLARRGYLRIRYFEHKRLIGKEVTFSFFKQKNADAALAEDEREIFEGIFQHGYSVTVDELASKHAFYKNVQKAAEQVWKRLAARGLFDGRPVMVRARYVAIAFAVGFILYGIIQSRPLAGVMSFATAAVVMIVGWFMPRRTKKGTNVMADIKGFEWFLSVTEKDRLDFHNAPERSSEQFLRFLPYAVALGIEKKWAAQFEGITIDQPEWADGSGWSSMSAAAFATRMGALSTSTGAMAAPPGSSGFSGGSSGGGGGGGGGGSW